MKIRSQGKETCSKSAKYSDLLEKGTGHPGSCWILYKGLDLKRKFVENLEEQHSMAFLGLASPSQANARNIHSADKVVRLLEVRLSLFSFDIHSKLKKRRMAKLNGMKCCNILTHHIQLTQSIELLKDIQRIITQ